MTNRKNPMTLDDHVALGRELRLAHDILQRAYVEVGQRYPLSSPAYRALARAVERLSEARCELDSRLYAEHPGRAAPTVYYGAPDTGDGLAA